MTRVEVRPLHDDGSVGDSYDIINTDIDTDDRIMRLFGLQFGFSMEKVEEHIYQDQYKQRYIIIR